MLVRQQTGPLSLFCPIFSITMNFVTGGGGADVSYHTLCAVYYYLAHLCKSLQVFCKIVIREVNSNSSCHVKVRYSLVTCCDVEI